MLVVLPRALRAVRSSAKFARAQVFSFVPVKLSFVVESKAIKTGETTRGALRPTHMSILAARRGGGLRGALGASKRATTDQAAIWYMTAR